MQRARLKKWLLLLIGAVLLIGGAALYWEFQNRRMPAMGTLLEEATQIALAQRDRLYNPDDYLLLADLWMAQGRPENARRLFQWLTEHPLGLMDGGIRNAQVQLAIALRWLKLNEINEAEKAFLRACSQALWLHHDPEIHARLTAFFLKYLETQPLARAKALAEKVDEEKRPTVLSALAAALRASGRQQEARQIQATPSLPVPARSQQAPSPLRVYLENNQLEEAIALYRRSSGYTEEWLLLAQKLIEQGRTEQALALFARNSLLSSKVRLMVARHYARQGQLNKALEVLEQIPSLKDEPALVEVADALAEGGHYRQALRIANALGATARSEALQHIAMSMIEHGRYGQAYRITQEAEPAHRLAVLCALLRQQARSL
ncbi:Tetratricopeptide repeat-containing protein [Armatimonadetes bacterium GBS]|jgi:tetratricopeptide (TPR) repeat protein|nr:MAG: hypothetical protein KatS3mg021_0168 [Fimbriimonadales bacterium]CUU11274.1 Tetratricopeptide repeat-containing protein [Armatimonadetes bacterium GBS]CUU34533.1 Tetratricopeptide repeat-containing protein [Armatimonadetes bacterium GXS]